MNANPNQNNHLFIEIPVGLPANIGIPVRLLIFKEKANRTAPVTENITDNIIPICLISKIILPLTFYIKLYSLFYLLALTILII